MTERRFNGWRREPKDARDHRLAVPPRIELPEEFSLMEYSSPNQNQYSTSSCVGNAVVNAMELLHIKLKGKEHHDDLSRLFVYWNARDYIKETNRDAGCFIRDAIKGVARYGVCYEKTWGFDAKKVCIEPPAVAYREAELMQILSYYRIGSTDRAYQVRYAISQGYPVIFGMDVYESFDQAAKTGVVPVPNPKTEVLQGGHAMCFEAFSNDRQRPGKKRYTCENSWGRNHGDSGFLHIPEEVVDDPSLSDDYWVIQIVEDPAIPVNKPAICAYLKYWSRRIFVR